MSPMAMNLLNDAADLVFRAVSKLLQGNATSRKLAALGKRSARDRDLSSQDRQHSKAGKISADTAAAPYAMTLTREGVMHAGKNHY